MPDMDLRYILLAGLAIALLFAAFTDIRSRHIGNRLNLGIALGAPLYWWASGLAPWPGMVWQLGVALVTFTALLAVFKFGGIGGGDVKLLTALALWFPPALFFKLIFMASVIGGLMTTVASLLNLKPAIGGIARRFVIFSSAALSVLVLIYAAWVMMGGAPLNLTSLGQGLAFGLFMLVLAYVGIGSIVMARAQRGKLRIPYGVAISTGGVWTLAAHLLPLIHHTVPTGGLG